MQTEEVVEVIPPEIPTFSELGLNDAVLKSVAFAGYERPTKIQAQAIPVLLQGKDLIGGSQTGTGKTAAFSLPIIHLLEKHVDDRPRCLVLEPTRELAVQVYENFKVYTKHSKLNLALLHGGVRYGRQREQIAKKPDIIIATPGRLLDYVGAKEVDLRGVKHLVLDEADRMLDMGFLPDVRKLIKKCGTKRQSLLFSATVPPEIERLSQWMLKDPETIKVGSGTSAAETVSHCIYPIDERQKFDLLTALLERTDYKSVLIFTRTKACADTIARWLENAGHGKVSVLHADRSQRERQNALKSFRSGESDILVATDIVARGIDISGITHVINYDIPQHPEDYVHRIGRTGRASSEGDAMTLYTAGESDFLKSIERLIGQEIERKELEGFDYRWSPVLEEEKPQKKRRNRGYSTKQSFKFGRR
jgi:superfamily II DNA/RNA helicase